MRKILFLFLLVTATARAEINWVDYYQAFDKAKKENKILFIYIYSPSCHYCDIMDFKVFYSKRVEDILNKNFIPVKLRKCSKEGMEIRKKYGFTGTPMFYFIEPNGKLIRSVFGAWEEKDFIKILEYFYSGAYKEMNMTEYFMK
ncbi:MAG: DUF255 domain-containing protein [Hydrogenothermaceae bacterium]